MGQANREPIYMRHGEIVSSNRSLWASFASQHFVNTFSIILPVDDKFEQVIRYIHYLRAFMIGWIGSRKQDGIYSPATTFVHVERTAHRRPRDGNSVSAMVMNEKVERLCCHRCCQ